MRLPVDFDSAARTEYLEAAAWYDAHRVGLGHEFIAEMGVVIQLISESPALFAQIENGVRQATIKRFPFSVIYRIEPARILVLAIFHSSRDPGTWKGR